MMSIGEVHSVQLGTVRASGEVYPELSQPRLGRVALDVLGMKRARSLLSSDLLVMVIDLLVGGRRLISRGDNGRCCCCWSSRRRRPSCGCCREDLLLDRKVGFGHRLLVVGVVILLRLGCLRLGCLRLGCLDDVFLDLVLNPMFSDPYVTKVGSQSMIVC